MPADVQSLQQGPASIIRTMQPETFPMLSRSVLDITQQAAAPARIPLLTSILKAVSLVEGFVFGKFAWIVSDFLLHLTDPDCFEEGFTC